MKGRGLARNAAQEILVNLQQISHSPPDGTCVVDFQEEQEQEAHERTRALQTRTRDVGFGLGFVFYITRKKYRSFEKTKICWRPHKPTCCRVFTARRAVCQRSVK